VKTAAGIFVAIIFTALFVGSAPAAAQATRTWVSGVGDDVNPCSRTAPCKTFAGAISKTTVNGEIDCLDPGGFGAVAITKSITIDCHDILGGIAVPDAATPGISINLDSFSQSDTTKTVNIRNLSISGLRVGVSGIAIQGNGAGSYVTIENCVIDGLSIPHFGIGIHDLRPRGALVVNNTIVRNMNIAGIFVDGTSAGSRRATIINSQITNTGIGIISGGNSLTVVINSVIASNITNGVNAQAGGQVILRGSTIAHNTNGMQIEQGTLIMDNSALLYNSTGFTGAISSASNNLFVGNGALGTITPIGSTSQPTGLR
jgi:hypothetical protein